jgi:hypothetical protein
MTLTTVNDEGKSGSECTGMSANDASTELLSVTNFDRDTLHLPYRAHQRDTPFGAATIIQSRPSPVFTLITDCSLRNTQREPPLIDRSATTACSPRILSAFNSRRSLYHKRVPLWLLPQAANGSDPIAPTRRTTAAIGPRRIARSTSVLRRPSSSTTARAAAAEVVTGARAETADAGAPACLRAPMCRMHRQLQCLRQQTRSSRIGHRRRLNQQPRRQPRNNNTRRRLPRRRRSPRATSTSPPAESPAGMAKHATQW